MDFKIKSGGTFHTVNDIRIKNSGTWNAVKEAWIKSGGTWSKFFSIGSQTNEIFTSAYIGGTFNTINSMSRLGGAAVNICGTGNILQWDPDANSSILTIVKDLCAVYFGGSFTTIKGNTRNRVAATDLCGAGNLLKWDPNAGGSVLTMVKDSSAIYIGGIFNTVKGISRNNVAAIDTCGTGNLLPWDPNAENIVRTMVKDTSTIYFGGNFYYIKDYLYARSLAACIDICGSGNVLPWDPIISGFQINCMVKGLSGIYIGGNISDILGELRYYGGAVSTQGTILPWYPDPNNHIMTLTSDTTAIYMGGAFNTIKGITRNKIAVMDTCGAGNLLPWSPNCTAPGGCTVYTIVKNTSAIYFGGDFSEINSSIPRAALAAVDLCGAGNLLSWYPESDGSVYVIAF